MLLLEYPEKEGDLKVSVPVIGYTQRHVVGVGSMSSSPQPPHVFRGEEYEELCLTTLQYSSGGFPTSGHTGLFAKL